MKITYTIVVIAVIALIGVGIGYNINKPEVNVGSVQQSSEYHATTTSTTGNITALIKNEGGALGSVIITGAGAGMVLYDASTTNATLRTISATSSLTVLADIPASLTAGTYTFDEIFYNGLLKVSGGVTGTSTITYR